MTLDQSLSWAVGHPWAVAAALALLLITTITVCWIIVYRTSGAVLTAGLGALVCTMYTADTSWRFAKDTLGMSDTSERLVMFAAGEIALLACAVMARANKRATATDDSAGTPGVPGVLVWTITGVQVIPAFAESGFWGGVIRATFGPVMAGLLWHLAMGLEVRVARPEALSSGLPAQIGAELRERLLSHLGLATRGRSAIEISRDRATVRVVRLASRRWLGPWGRAALAASVTRSGAMADPARHHTLMQLLAGRRSARELRTVPLESPWAAQPTPAPAPAALAAAPQPQDVSGFDHTAATALAVAQPTPPAAAAAAAADGTDAQPQDAAEEPEQPTTATEPSVQPAPQPDAQPRLLETDAQLLERALALNTQSLTEDGKKAPLRLLQTELGIGQRRAQRIQAQLPDTPPAADAQPPARKAADR